MSLPVLQDLLAKLTSPYGGHYQVTSEDLNWEVNSPNTCTLDIAGTSITAHMTKHEQTAGEQVIDSPVVLDTRTDNFTGRTINDGSGWGTASDGTVWTFADYDGGSESPLPLANIIDGAGAQISNQYGDGPGMVFGDPLASDDTEWLVRFSFGNFVSEEDTFAISLIHRSPSDVTLPGQANLSIWTNGVTNLNLWDGNNGDTSIGSWDSQFNAGTLNPGDKYWCRFRAVGQTFMWKIWFDGMDVTEPSEWLGTYTTSNALPSSDLRASWINMFSLGGLSGVNLGSVDRATLVSAKPAATKTITDTFVRADQNRWGATSDGKAFWAVSEQDGSGLPEIVSNQAVAHIYSGDSALNNYYLTLVNGTEMWNVLPTDGELSRDLLVRWKANSTAGGARVKFLLYTNSYDQGTYITLLLDGNSIYIDTPNSETVDSPAFDSIGGFSVDTCYWTRFKRVGARYTFSLWVDGDDESTAWTSVYDDVVYEAPGNTPGLGIASFGPGEDVVFTFDHFSVTSTYNTPSPRYDTPSWKVQPSFVGIWNPSHDYSIGDIVYNLSDDSFYRALTAHTAVILDQDDFHRDDQSGGWGTSAGGTEWAISGDPAPFSILNNEGVFSDLSGGKQFTYDNQLETKLVDLVVRFSFDAIQDTPEFSHVQPYQYASYWWVGISNNNSSWFEVDVENDGYMDSEAGTDSSREGLNSSSGGPVFIQPLTDYYFRQRAFDPYFGFKVWRAQDPEPVDWAILYQVVDTITDDGPFSTYGYLNSFTGNTLRFKSWTYYDGRGTDPSLDSVNWVAYPVAEYDEFANYTEFSDVVLGSKINTETTVHDFGGVVMLPVKLPYILNQVNDPSGYTDTVDSHSATFDLYETDGHLPVLGTNDEIPNVEDWLRGEMDSFFGAGNVADLNSWTVGVVPEALRDLIALTLVKGIE